MKNVKRSFFWARIYRLTYKNNELRASFWVFEQEIAFRNRKRVLHLLLLKFRHNKSIRRKKKFSLEYMSETLAIFFGPQVGEKSYATREKHLFYSCDCCPRFARASNFTLTKMNFFLSRCIIYLKKRLNWKIIFIKRAHKVSFPTNHKVIVFSS